MNIEQISKIYKSSKGIKLIEESLSQKNKASISEIVGSGLSLLVAEFFNKNKISTLLICDDKEEAAYYLNDLEQLIGKDTVFFFPSSYKKPYQIEETQNSNVLLRAEVLSKISDNSSPSIIVTYTEAIFEKVITEKVLKNNTITLKVGQQIKTTDLTDVFIKYNFKNVDFVTEPGEFSIRGGIVDVFSFSYDFPLRIEFFGNEIDSIRSFDVESQLSVEKLKKTDIIPNIEDKRTSQVRNNIFETIPKNTVVFTKDYSLYFQKLDSMFSRAEQIFQQSSSEITHLPPQDLFCNGDEIKNSIQNLSWVNVEIGSKNNSIPFGMSAQPNFNKNFNLLTDNLSQKYNEGFSNYIFCVTEQQAKRFEDIFSELHQDVPCKMIVCPIYMGFCDNINKINVYSDHQILERYHKFNIRNGYEKKQSLTLKELSQLIPGDYVTHIDHGIGRFAGLEHIEVNGKKQEAIKLIYGERDVLFVGIHSLYKIAKYTGKEGVIPKIHRLGSNAWKALKQKTKVRVKEIAFNLIKLYAKRKEALGYAFPPDSLLQKELEASFLYEDTPDQVKAITDVKADMESSKPMDRLVCGDVGFGKTEVAVRAAFKAVDSGKQVVVLVPTTILAFQHYNTFAGRMKDLPVRIEYINRFRSAKDKKLILEDVEKGKVDILIGTHQIVGKSVKYKNLGLLIIDEEQKFGVAVKDKLKTLRENIDVLTLTATPIPRTLQFSLMAARDLSVITTPPPNRYPIESNIISFDQDIIRDAISYEIQRGGQIFFIHNRVENIKEVAGMIQRLVPDARIAIGHGQMDGKKLEEIMLDFMNGYYDILVATTIIESGLDVPNANTIFIHNAQNFGLSDLHQMRGRVGRSNKKAFCYFITPPLSSMGTDARKRIEAIAQFSDLGSGINVAMKDLEIRGAGDLLGGEQSGFITDIGFETYQKILQEAVNELKDNEFAELYDHQEEKTYVSDTQVDTDFEILFPEEYVKNVSERLNLYRKLSEIASEEKLIEYQNELIDRFGKLPKQITDLFDSLRIKWIAASMGFEKIALKQGKMTGYFISDPQNKFYQSDTFNVNVMNFVKKNYKSCKMIQKNVGGSVKLMLSFENVTSVQKGLAILKEYQKN